MNQTCKIWTEEVMSALFGTSRTLSGISDTSSSKHKPKLSVAEGETLAINVQENIVLACKMLWGVRKREFSDAAGIRLFVDELVSTVNDGLLIDDQLLYRTWETKFLFQVKPHQIETEYIRFCEWLTQALDTVDAVVVAAEIERELNWRIHPFADACGRVSKLLSAFVLLRKGFSPPKYKSQEEYYAAMNFWLNFYRDLCSDGAQVSR